MAAVKAWLASDYSDGALLDNSVKVLLEVGEPAFRPLADLLRDAVETGDQRSASGLTSVITRLCLGFMQREVESEVVYAGQYDRLRILMPYTGRFYMGLLLDTPDWFPDTQRWQVVASLRDLYPDSPGEIALGEMQTIAEDRDFESEAVRVALGYALAQWGRRELVNLQIERLEQDRREGDQEDQLFVLKTLADVHYQIRDYKTSARLHKEFLSRANESGFPIGPVDYYNAACNYCLTGDLESAYKALEACAELQESVSVDSSLKLERDLFDNVTGR